ncbi:GYDIA family GHMP kinase [Marinifilum caeruleilacunae]|uniref:GHMP kinase n=1 Tax=Marinifilum caeruleilacunae TaxID=2499076 RepID=A0ABX1WYW8_9BACT|nr:GYDIA family GHMP kinase [Marinifilum caeruleilacunae]NOU61084.1 GHMP kinase [Marinifilum caeruleilacunae]
MLPVKKYYSNAKFLITGEYLVLHGSLSLAIPLRFGQFMEIYESDSKDLEWIALDRAQEWLHFSISEDEVLQADQKGKTEKDFVCFLLKQAKQLNPEFLKNFSWRVKSEINFDRKWGLGSSSSLINNVAQWADVNPYELHAMVSKGSGYDIACANYCLPILFRRNGSHPMIYPIKFQPKFSEQLYFVYLGNKQNSEESVAKFLNGNPVTKTQVESISLLSKKLLQSENAFEFDALISEHERFISEVLNCDPIKSERFSDFKGSIKSLGAWGGDFILVRSDDGKREVHRYFYEKGLSTIFSWDEIILS